MYCCFSCSKQLLITSLYFTCQVCPDKRCFCANCFLESVCKTHAYQVSQNPETSYIRETKKEANRWNASEELLLLEGLQMFGFGNWRIIAKHIGSKHSYECFFFYLNTYIKEGLQKSSPTPQTDFEHLRLSPYEEELAAQQVQKMKRESINFNSLKRKYNVSGYMPARDEYKTEYNNDFEKTLTKYQPPLKPLDKVIDDKFFEAIKKYREYYKVILARNKRRKVAKSIAFKELTLEKNKLNKHVSFSYFTELLQPLALSIGYEKYVDLRDSLVKEMEISDLVTKLEELSEKKIENHQYELSTSCLSKLTYEVPTGHDKLETNQFQLNALGDSIIGQVVSEDFKQSFNQTFQLALVESMERNKVIKRSAKTGKYYTLEKDLVPGKLIVDGQRNKDSLDLYLRLKLLS